ncbi:MAG: hypothetical protein J0L73_10535 [Verrucomicrobia bacterium]|nr:hypothetical protein [Verrucomicrobiota bacterium]
MLSPSPFIRCGILIAYLALPYAAPAADAPLAPAVQQRLETLKSGYESFVVKSVSIPFEEGVKRINAQAQPALERESAAAAARKDLEGLVRIKADIDRIAKGQVLTAVSEPPPVALKSVYAAYKLELAKLEATQQSGLANARQRYDLGLAQVQDELTTAQDVAAALHVKQLRDELAKASPSQRAAKTTNADGLATVEMSGEQAKFEEGAMAYTNRPFVLSKVPPSLKRLTFIKNAGGAKTTTTIDVLSPGKIYIACAVMDNVRPVTKDLEYLLSLGFEKTHHKFVIYNLSMVICSKDVDSTFTLPPAESFGGFMVIGNVSAKK